MALGLTLESALESRHQRARGQPEQERQQQRRRARRRAERAGTRMYSQRSAFSWERQPLRQLKNRTFSNQSALVSSSLARWGVRVIQKTSVLTLPVAGQVEEVLVLAGVTVGGCWIVLALKPAALQSGPVVPDVD